MSASTQERTDTDGLAAGARVDLASATQAAALAAWTWVGRGDKNAVDGAAVDAMRRALAGLAIDGTVVIGEGEKDSAPMLFTGERVGSGSGFACDVAVDPVDGTRLAALGLDNAISALAVSERGAMFDASSVFYMEKLAAGPAAAGVLDLRLPLRENVFRLAEVLGRDPGGICVAVLDRPRHDGLVDEIRATGARVRLLQDGDVAAAIAAVTEGSGVDLMLGSGGSPEGVLAAAAVRCFGGVFQGRLWPQSAAERAWMGDRGYESGRVLSARDLVAGDDVVFVATGVTDGSLLRGVRSELGVPVTHSLVADARTGVRHLVETRHPQHVQGSS
jgi:fructose-1,6-bisphosphatase II